MGAVDDWAAFDLYVFAFNHEALLGRSHAALPVIGVGVGLERSPSGFVALTLFWCVLHAVPCWWYSSFTARP